MSGGSAVILWRNRADEAILTTPRPWVRGIENLQTRVLSEVARTGDCTDLENTRFLINLRQRRAIRGIVIPNNNLTTRARYRVRARLQPDSPVLAYDSGWQDAYRRLFTWRELRWGDPNFWFGRPAEEDLEGFTRNLIHILPETIDAAYWDVELDDTTNPDGYLDLGRLFIAGGSKPSRNYSPGASLGYETNTKVSRSRTGVKFFDRREPIRIMRFVLEFLPEQEILERWLEVQRRMGLDGEVFVIPDDLDEINMTRRAFLGTLRTLSPWEQILDGLGSIGFEIEEIL